jgi:hypothetical protein
MENITKGNESITTRKSLRYMSKRDMKKMCEGLKTIGIKYKIDDTEKNVMNDIMYCIQIGWEQINGRNDDLIQL